MKKKTLIKAGIGAVALWAIGSRFAGAQVPAPVPGPAPGPAPTPTLLPPAGLPQGKIDLLKRKLRSTQSLSNLLIAQREVLREPGLTTSQVAELNQLVISLQGQFPPVLEPVGAEEEIKTVSKNIEIVVYDEQGRPVPHNSPIELIEGQSYKIGFSVTNTSSRAGQPVGVTMLVRVETTLGLAPQEWRQVFGPGETIIWSPDRGNAVEFNVPILPIGQFEQLPITQFEQLPVGKTYYETYYGRTQGIKVLVHNEAGLLVASASEDIIIKPAEIVYGAEVMF